VDILHEPRDFLLHVFCFARRQYLHLVLIYCKAQGVSIYQIERQEEHHSQHDNTLERTVISGEIAHQCLNAMIWLLTLQNLSLYILQYLHFCYAENDTETHRKSQPRLLLNRRKGALHKSEEHVKGNSEAQTPIKPKIFPLLIQWDR